MVEQDATFCLWARHYILYPWLLSTKELQGLLWSLSVPSTTNQPWFWSITLLVWKFQLCLWLSWDATIVPWPRLHPPLKLELPLDPLNCCRLLPWLLFWLGVLEPDWFWLNATLTDALWLKYAAALVVFDVPIASQTTVAPIAYRARKYQVYSVKLPSRGCIPHQDQATVGKQDCK